MRYRVHKRFAVSVGIFIILWCISGIAMILPLPQFEADEKKTQLVVNYAAARLSPADVVATLGKDLQKSIQVRSVSMLQIRDSLAYRIVLRTGESHLINTGSGKVFLIDAKLAEQIARDEFPTRAQVREIVQLVQHQPDYPRGPIPVYRVLFDDSLATTSFVAIQDGSVRRNNRWTRLRDRIVDIHTFRNVIVGHEWLRRGLLLLLAVVALATATTGYYLALRKFGSLD